jgi:hypothetical protein
MVDVKTRIWRWKVEPGMEGAFEDLQGWLLSSQRDTAVETVRTLPASPPSHSFRRNPLWSRCCARVAYRAA